MIAKHWGKREQIHPVCLHAVEKYEISTKQQVKNEQIKRKLFDKKKQFVLSVHFVKCLIPRKQVQDR